MKKLFTILAVAAAMVSCAKEEVVSFDQGEAIEFGNAFVDNATRADQATDPSYSTTTGKGVALTQFNVYGAVEGVNIFNGNAVTKGDAAYGAAWTLTGAKQYWIAGADYKFVGVVDGNKTGVTAITPDTAGLPSTISYTVDGATDLLCDVVTIDNATAPYSIVAFNYTHLLSKVKFSVKNTTDAAATNYRFVLTSAKLTNVYEDGVYNVNTDTWTPGATMREYVLDNLTINSAATQYHSQEVLLIPGSKKVGVYVKANIEASSDNGTTWKVISDVEKTFPNVVELEKAKAYNFIVELGVGTEIQFTATTMPEWGNGNTQDSDGDTVKDYIPLQ